MQLVPLSVRIGMAAPTRQGVVCTLHRRAAAHAGQRMWYAANPRFVNRSWKSRPLRGRIRQGEKKMRTKSLAGVLIALLLIAGASAASAQEVTPAEKDNALQYLETTKKNVLEATKGLSEAQWDFKPAPDRWSGAQLMEHIAA